MKHILFQTLRLVLGLFGLGMAAAGVVTTVHWVTNIHELADPQELSWERTPFTSHVTFPLERAKVADTYASRWREGHRLVRLDTPVEPLVDLGPQAFEELMGGQRLLIQGMVTSGQSQDVLPLAGQPMPSFASKRLLMVLHKGEPYPMHQAWWGVVFVFPALLIAWLALRSFRRHRHAHGPGPRQGFFERLAIRYPAPFRAMYRLTINGFGVELFDYHEPGSDGSCLATRWLTVAYLPVAPIGRVRVRFTGERTRGIPLVVSYTTTAHEILERLPVDQARSLRVYLFYYLLFVPLSVGPVLGFLAWVVLSRPGLSAGLFWTLLGACMAWGVGMVWVQERVMKRPARVGSAPPAP